MHTGFSMHRVKVYKLNVEGQWEDKGTGHISVEYMEQAHAMGLVVISEEENGKTLLVHQISREDIYSRSGESTIITWHDGEISTDVAISFQEQAGCDQIWHQIKQVQQDEHRRLQDHERGRKSTVDEYDQPPLSVAHAGNGDLLDNDMDLPAPERRNLEDIAKGLSHVPPFQRDRIAQQLMKLNYLPALLDLFKQCEDLEDGEGLAHMHAIVRSAIMLNDSSVLEEMLREEHVMDVLGALEYDPDCGKQPVKHREFLQSHVQFKEVVPISSPAILAKIHQTYRIQYLKDVILPRSLDDATYATLSSLALFNNMEVVGALVADPAFLPQLFQRLQTADPGKDPQQWHDLVAFLQEFCSLARHLQQQQRSSLFARLISLGLFEVVTRILGPASSEAVKVKAVDVLMSSMQHDVLALREFLYKQPDHTLFGLLVHELTDGRDTGLAEQVCEAIKLLMDPDTMEQPVEKNEFLEVFYDKYLDRLIGVILSDSSINPSGTRVVPATTLGLILELLSFCVQNHSYRIRYYTLRNHLVEKVLRLLHRRERWLVCATVRFMRVCVALKEDFFTRYLLRYNCFGPLMVVFFENGERYNLLNSAVLDLIDFIRRENIKPLLEHLVETYGHRFDELSYVDTFKQLRLKYEQAPERAGGTVNGGPAGGRGGDGDMADGPQTAGAAAAAGIQGRVFVLGGGSRAATLQAHGRRRRRDDRDLEKDEEDYFSEDADDEQEDVQQRPHAHHHPAIGPQLPPQQQQMAIAHTAAGYGLGAGGSHAGPDLGRRSGTRAREDESAQAGTGEGAAAGAAPEAAMADVKGDNSGGGTPAAPAAGPGPEAAASGLGLGGLLSDEGPVVLTGDDAVAATNAELAKQLAASWRQHQQQQLQAAAAAAPAVAAATAAATNAGAEPVRPWPGLVDYDDDEEDAHMSDAGEQRLQQQQQPPQQQQQPGTPLQPEVPAPPGSSSGQSEGQQQQQQSEAEGGSQGGAAWGNGPHAARGGGSAGRSPGPDLGRRPRSEEADGVLEGDAGTPGEQEQRKRARSDCGGGGETPEGAGQ